MGQVGELDTDTNALTSRINAHAIYGSGNLEEWVFAQLDVQPDQKILEIGCGTGKQTIPLARLIGEDGHINAVDIAAASLSLLRRHALEEGLMSRISLINCAIDDTESYLRETEEYDRTLACYSIYYANDPDHVFSRVHGKLKHGGRLFFCGPAETNNAELKTFHNKLSGKKLPASVASFMEDEGQKLARKLFERVYVSTFVNPLCFDNAVALYDYWRSHNLYDPQIDRTFMTAADDYFSTHNTFVTNKRVFGVLAVK